MKKQSILALAAFLFISINALSQHILKSDHIYDGRVLETNYIFIRSDSKQLSKDWETYLNKFGKVDESKGEITVTDIKTGELSTYLDKMVSFIQDNKTFSTVNVLFLDENDNTLAPAQINQKELERFFYDFYDLAYFNEEVRMAEADLELAEDLMEVAKKDQGKAERNLEANLRAQEKLGKKLDKSPEELSKVISEKDEIFQELLKSSMDTTATEKSSELKEEVEKKEKQLIKIKEKKDRDADRLVKREKEFPELTEKLFEARKTLEKAEQVVESKKLVTQDLKKK